MLDPNAEIEQFIYTGCWDKAGHAATGFLSYWSTSKGVKTTGTLSHECAVYGGDGRGYSGCRFSDIRYMGMSTKMPLKDCLYHGRDKKCRADLGEIRKNVRQLKPGAVPKPKGLFRKKYDYDDSDYEDVPGELIRGEVKILDESFSGSYADLDQEIQSTDFRKNPEKAPYRIVATKLPDGRLLVVRRSFINKEYKNDENPRNGNFFDHAMIFPAGTEIEDLEGLELPFLKGLDEKNYIPGPDSKVVPPPEHLDTLHARDFKKKNASHNSQRGASKPQQTPQPQQPQAEQKPKPKPIKEKLNMTALYTRAAIVLRLRRQLAQLSENPDENIYNIEETTKNLERVQQGITESLEEGTTHALKLGNNWIVSKQGLLLTEAEDSTLSGKPISQEEVMQSDEFKACDVLGDFINRELETRGAIKKRA